MGSCCSSSKQQVENPTMIQNKKQFEKIEYDTESLLQKQNDVQQQMHIGKYFFDQEKFQEIQAYPNLKYEQIQKRNWENIIQKYTVKSLAKKQKNEKEQQELIDINKYFLNKQHQYVYQFCQQEKKLFNSLLASTPPHEYRWAAWKAKIFDPKIYKKDYYEILSSYKSKKYNDIQKDTNRGFPEHPYFRNQQENEQNISTQQTQGQEQLLRILNAISNYFPDLGYTQGMHLVVGFVLMISGGNEQETFWFFVNLCLNENFNILGFFEKQFPLLHFLLFIFDSEFEKIMPGLYKHIKESNISEYQWIFSWIMTLFLYSFPINYCVYLWDFIISENNFSIISLAIGIVQQLEVHILKMDQFDFSNFLKKLKDPNILLNKESEYFIDFVKLIKFAKNNLIKDIQIQKYAEKFKKHKPIVEMDVNNKNVQYYSQFTINKEKQYDILIQNIKENKGIISQSDIDKILNQPDSPLKLQKLQSNSSSEIKNKQNTNNNLNNNINNNNNELNIQNQKQQIEKNDKSFQSQKQQKNQNQNEDFGDLENQNKQVNLINFDNSYEKSENNDKIDLSLKTIKIQQTPNRNEDFKQNNNLNHNKEVKSKQQEKGLNSYLYNSEKKQEIIQEQKENENNNNKNDQKQNQLLKQISMCRDSSNNLNKNVEPIQFQTPIRPLKENLNILNLKEQKQSSYEENENQIQNQNQNQQQGKDKDKDNDKENEKKLTNYIKKNTLNNLQILQLSDSFNNIDLVAKQPQQSNNNISVNS